MFNLFILSRNKVLPFRNNINDEVYSNDKDEVVSMVVAVPKQSNAITHYALYLLRANVQFSAIETLIKSMKTDPSVVYMVPYHEKKVSQMSYLELQVG